MEQGWDPEVRKYFRKIINTLFIGLFWLMTVLTAGLYFGLAAHHNTVYRVIFFAGLLVSLAFLLRYYYKTWR